MPRRSARSLSRQLPDAPPIPIPRVFVGRELLANPSPAKPIAFPDLFTLLDRCKASDDFVASTDCGREIQQATRDKRTAANTKVRNIGKALLRALHEAVEQPREQGSEVPDLLDPNRLLWTSKECLTPVPKPGLDSLSRTDYARLHVGKQAASPVTTALHRFACFLACGDPTQECKLATHRCGNKRCLRPACLVWGSWQSNRKDWEDKARPARRAAK